MTKVCKRCNLLQSEFYTNFSICVNCVKKAQDAARKEESKRKKQLKKDSQ
jgi:hypothetical protein